METGVFNPPVQSLRSLESGGCVMSGDEFAQRMAAVRRRFASKLESRLSDLEATVPALAAGGSETTAHVFTAHRNVHDLCGLGPTLGFDAIGKAARVVERVLLAPSRERRGPTDEEMVLVREGLRGLRAVAQAELQSPDLGE
jgi:chemotaxis protein histidine kinase CheA